MCLEWRVKGLQIRAWLGSSRRLVSLSKTASRFGIQDEVIPGTRGAVLM